MKGEIGKCKREFVLDMIRRVVANPGNARKVADAIASDWNPTIVVRADGSCDFGVSEEAD
jgi:hypothetical protein